MVWRQVVYIKIQKFFVVHELPSMLIYCKQITYKAKFKVNSQSIMLAHIELRRIDASKVGVLKKMKDNMTAENSCRGS